MGAAMSIIGAGLGAAGSYMEGRAAYNAAQYNARLAEQNAVLVRQKAQRDASILKTQGQKFLAGNIASAAAAGVRLEGSAFDVLAENARLIKRDELNILRDAELNARGFQMQADQERNQGKLAKTMGYFGAASSVLGGIGSAGRMQSLNRSGGGTGSQIAGDPNA
jgi:hypothetical protein